MTSHSDDITTAIGTCGSYDRLQTLRQRRHLHQNLHQHHHQQQQQQQQQQDSETNESYDESITREIKASILNDETNADDSETDRILRHKHHSPSPSPSPSSPSHLTSRGFLSWTSGTGRRLMMTSLALMTFLACVAVSSGQGVEQYIVQPDNQTVSQGLTALFECTIENRQGSVQWAQGDFALGVDRELPGFPRYRMLGGQIGNSNREEFNLQIRDVVLEEDEGSYECQVGPHQGSRGMRSRKAYLFIVVPPERPIIVNGSTVRVVLNRPSRILCIANNGKPAPEITWYFAGERITDNVSIESTPHGKRINATGILTLTATMNHHAKRIVCKANQQFMSQPYETSAILDVQYPPKLSMSLNVTSRTLREHDYVRFQCTDMSNPPVKSWQWHRNNKPIPGATSKTYIIRSLSPDYNNDVISCVAINQVGTSRLDQTLNVQYGPRITNITAVVGADVGLKAELKCDVDGNPSPSIIWRRKDLSTKSHHVLWTKPIYRIERVSRSSFGAYVCIAAVEGFADTSKEAMLIKNDRPNPRSEKRQEAEKGERGVVQCLVNSIPKPRNVKWSKGRREIKNDVGGRFLMNHTDMMYGRRYYLIIKSVQSGDFGMYNCTVENEYGSSYDEIELAEKYSVPITYIIIGIIGGFAIIFVVVLICVLYRRYRKDDQGSVLGSYTDTDSSSDKKLREKADSPSTLMGQFRQGYGKDTYRFSADYDDVPYKNGNATKEEAQEGARRKETQSLLSWATCRKWRQEQTKGNNNGYGFIEPYESYSDHPIYDGEYVHGGEEPIPSDRFDSLYSTGTGGFNMSSFRGNNYDSTPPPTMTRITPIHMNNSKLATDV